MKRIYLLLLLIIFAIGSYSQTGRYAEHSVLSSGKWVKIRVSSDGVYQLTKDNLKKMGFSDPTKVRLYGYNRPILPEAYIENIEDDLVEIPLYRSTSTGAYLFYSKGITEWNRKSASTMAFTHKNNPYSKYIYYFLTEDDTVTPTEFKQVSSQSSYTTTQSTYYAHSLIETDAFSFLNCGRTFFESYDYSTGSTKSYSLSLPGLVSSDVLLSVKFGASDQSSVTVKSGSTTLGKLSLGSLRDTYQYATVNEGSYTVSDYSTQKMAVTLQHNRSSDVTGHLDYIQASYECPLNIKDQNYIAFGPNTTGTTAFDLSGISGNVSVWNVTSPSSTYELAVAKSEDAESTTSGKTNTYIAENAQLNDLFVAVNTDQSFPAPETVGTVANQDLHSLENIQLLIIVPANGLLTDQAQRLADAHYTKDGMRCYVVTADKVYNEFSSGTPDATAYRRMMKMLYDKAAEGTSAFYPENLLLFGSGMWDNRFVTSGLKSNSQDDYLLFYESDNSWSHTLSWTLEEYFALLDDGEGVSPLKEKPDAGVGRLPVTTVDEAKNVVNKIISYINNTYAGSWKNTVCILGDDGDANTHIKGAEEVASYTESLYPLYKYRRIYWDAYTRVQTATGNDYPDVKTDIKKVMDDGALIVDYTGHGSAYCLSHEKVLQTKDFQDATSPRLPLWFTAACDVCPIDMNTENIGNEAVLNEQGGAIAFIGTTRSVYPDQNKKINKAFLKYALGQSDSKQRYTIGEALAMAKSDIVAQNSRYIYDSINKCQFVLIGDPAVTLSNPSYKIVIDTFNGKDVDNDDDEEEDVSNASAGEVVTISGHVVDENNRLAEDFEGIISPTVYDNLEHIICKNNDGSADTPFDYYDYKRKLYEGSDSIHSGTFTFSFPVPLDNNYSNETGLINLYAITTDKGTEANGRFTDFTIGGTSTEIGKDTIGPTIATYINSSNTIDGEKVNDTPTIHVYLNDESGINSSGNGLGHDIVAILDGKESTTYTLNNYFTQTVGDYTSGVVDYTFPTIEAGSHVLTIRAFDTFNNMSEQSYHFEVYENLEKKIEIYDFAGRLITADDTKSLPRGAYVKKTIYMSGDEEVTHDTKKVIIK